MIIGLTGFVQKGGQPRSRAGNLIFAGKHLRAFTLAEVVIATAIIVILGGGIIGSINYGFFVMRLARENQRATQIMLEKIESIRLYDWTQVNSNGFIPTSFTNVFDPQSPAGEQGIAYYGWITNTDVVMGSTYHTNLRQFTVTVQWTNAGRVAHTRRATTYVAKDGMQNYVY
jgi:type II secretory pathway pseudopilin PulG